MPSHYRDNDVAMRIQNLKPKPKPGMLGGGAAAIAAKLLKKRKKKLDDEIRKQGG